MAANKHLADIAEAEAHKFYHGNIMGSPTNLHPISDLFPYSKTWDINSWDNCWCAAFVYWCCVKAGYKLPVRYESDKVSCNFAGCIAWEQWAKLPEVGCWMDRNQPTPPHSGRGMVVFGKEFDAGFDTFLTASRGRGIKPVAYNKNPEIGDIVIFDRIFKDEEHDHIAIVLDSDEHILETAEGNFNNVSAIVKRPYDNVRGYLRLQPLPVLDSAGGVD